MNSPDSTAPGSMAAGVPVDFFEASRPSHVELSAPDVRIYERAPAEVEAPLQQGEFISDIVQQILNLEHLKRGEAVLDEVPHPYVIVVTQTCDLEWDAKSRGSGDKPERLLPSVLLCEALTAHDVRHRKGINGTLWPRIRDNKDERYHFFEAVPPDDDSLGVGIPEIVVDFKRYFSLPTTELYWKLTSDAKRRTRLRNPYLEHFASRFFYFQARVATPRPHDSAP